MQVQIVHVPGVDVLLDIAYENLRQAQDFDRQNESSWPSSNTLAIKKGIDELESAHKETVQLVAKYYKFVALAKESRGEYREYLIKRAERFLELADQTSSAPSVVDALGHRTIFNVGM